MLKRGREVFFLGFVLVLGALFWTKVRCRGLDERIYRRSFLMPGFGWCCVGCLGALFWTGFLLFFCCCFLMVVYLRDLKESLWIVMDFFGLLFLDCCGLLFFVWWCFVMPVFGQGWRWAACSFKRDVWMMWGRLGWNKVFDNVGLIMFLY
jgi:hypothetical protein